MSLVRRIPFTLLFGSTLVTVLACAGGPRPEPAVPPSEPAPLPEPASEAAPEPTATNEPKAEPAPEPTTEVAETPSDAAEVKKPISLADTPPGAAPPKPPPEIEGKLVARTKNAVRVKLAGQQRPEKDQSLSLLRFFSGKAGDKSPIGALAGIFGAKVAVSGWVSVADVRVTKVDGAVVTLEIEKEKSKVVVNGKPTNHFTPGAKLKLTARD